MSPHLSSRSDEVVLRSLVALLAELPACVGIYYRIYQIDCAKPAHLNSIRKFLFGTPFIFHNIVNDNNIIAHLLAEQLLRHPLVVHLQHNSESQGNARKDKQIP